MVSIKVMIRKPNWLRISYEWLHDAHNCRTCTCIFIIFGEYDWKSHKRHHFVNYLHLKLMRNPYNLKKLKTVTFIHQCPVSSSATKKNTEFLHEVIDFIRSRIHVARDGALKPLHPLSKGLGVTMSKLRAFSAWRNYSSKETFPSLLTRTEQESSMICIWVQTVHVNHF